jgi:hypothetical protein
LKKAPDYSGVVGQERLSGEADAASDAAPAQPPVMIPERPHPIVRLAPSQWFGALLVGSVLAVNLLAAWVLSGDAERERLAYGSGWVEEAPADRRASSRAPVTVFAAPMAERRTARYLSIDALDTPDVPLPRVYDAPPPEAAQ